MATMAAKKHKRSTPKKRKAPGRKASKRKPSTPLRWVLSDGTVVHLGGEIEGTSAFAAELRQELANNPQLLIGLMPSTQDIALDVNDAVLVNEWLRQRTASRKLTLVEAPKNVPDVSDRWPDLYESVPGRIY